MFNSSKDSPEKLMKKDKSNSNINNMSNTFVNTNKLDQSVASFKTKNSAENEYDE